MGKSLVIVESPAKASTIKKYLGKDFQVKASVGHVIDLPVKTLGVDVEKGFSPQYEIIKGKKKVLNEIKKLAASVDTIYLAPDPDREGEAIAWHISDYIKAKNKKVHRVLFNEITKKAVTAAIKNPLKLDLNKYQAQQARRILDRLVGYKISPILWKKVRRGLSAGRVQSVALRMIVEREQEHNAFKSEEYWSITALFAFDGNEFEGRLFKVDGKKPNIDSEKDAKAIVDAVQPASFTVIDVQRKERRKNPVAPFITSQLQQDGARKLGFTTKKTMMLAQRLYEGMELGSQEASGLITYMRTDSTRVSNEAMADVRSYISKQYGAEYVPKQPNTYKTKKAAQEAHEAIRPTSMANPPSKVKPYVERDMFRLYELIWNRFVASQMSPAVMDQTTVNIEPHGDKAPAGKYLFRSTGQVVKFLGFLAVYREEREEIQRKKGEVEEDDSERTLPVLAEKNKLNLKEVKPNQHFTEPPPLYSEASLVKAMEDSGIGRPSTYSATLTSIQNREYAVKEEKRFHATELGRLVTDLLTKSFPKIMDIEFTAKMEEELDLVEEGKNDWVKMLKSFYKPFSERIVRAEKEMRDVKKEETPTEHNCEKCKAPMIIKWGRRGQFLACSSYPDCKNTKEFIKTKEGKVEIQKAETTDEKCEKCESPMAIKRGRFGRFLACTKYPDCKFTKSITTGVKCFEKECDGEIVERRSKRGKIFYSCSKYPECKFATWYQPVKKKCPTCGAAFLVLKISKKTGNMHSCINKECGFSEEAPESS